jgi:hypothetical protein
MLYHKYYTIDYTHSTEQIFIYKAVLTFLFYMYKWDWKDIHTQFRREGFWKMVKWKIEK